MRKRDWAVVIGLLAIMAVPIELLVQQGEREKQEQFAREQSYCAKPYASETLCNHLRKAWNN